MKKVIIALGAAAILAACQSTPTTIPEDLSQPEMFQRAQEAFANGNYDAAVLYYETFIERFPEDTQNRIAARYEIAFIHYKRGNLDEAERRFRDILDHYEASGQDGSSRRSNGSGSSSEGASADGGDATGPGAGQGDSLPGGDGFAQTQAPGSQSGGLPEWPRVLAEKLLQRIEEQRNEENPLG